MKKHDITLLRFSLSFLALLFTGSHVIGDEVQTDKIPIHPDKIIAESFKQADRQLIVGSEFDYPPFALITPEGQADGYSVDLIKAVAEVMKLNIHFKTGPWSEVRAALENREIDILPLVGYSEERDKKMDFTMPHTIVYDSIFIRKEDAEKFQNFHTITDLKEKKVIVLRSDNANDYVVGIGVSTENIVLADTNPQAMKMLASGQYDYVLMPKLMGLLIIRDEKLDNIQPIGSPIEDYTRAFCFAVKDGDVKLVTLLNDGLNIIKATGQYDEIYDKWFGALESKTIDWRLILKIIFFAVTIFLILLTVSFAWSLSLKKQVAQRTKELQIEINERKRIEIDLRNAKTTLEDAYHKAEAANRTKGQFLANMSHELRTPLNGILGYAQIFLRDKNLTNKQLEGARIIQCSGEYLLSLINDILDISKIEAQHTTLQPTDFRFITFLHTTNELIEIRARQKNINFIYKPSSQLPTIVHADEKRLRQILINLLGNAVKFTQQGGVTFKVSYQNNQLFLEIEDTGIGIAEKDLEIIFEPFQQVNASFNDKTEGTGLGLTIAKKLIDMMSGQLEVISELGKGSRFSVILPMPKVTQSSIIETEKEISIITGFIGVKKKILVIDDKWENCSVITNLLTPLGFEVTEASNGREGLAKLNEIYPDLVLTDLVMPIMDGFEFMRQIKKMPSFAQIPVIALSASFLDYQPDMDMSCVAFIPKPFQIDELLAAIQQQLDLTWLYDTDLQPTQQQIAQSIEKKQLIDYEIYKLTATQVEILFTLSMEGDIYGLQKAAAKLAQEDAELKPFMDLIYQLAEQFNTDKVCELLEYYRKS